MPRTPHFLHNRGLPDVVSEMRKPAKNPYTGWIGVGSAEFGDPDPVYAGVPTQLRTAANEWVIGISPPFLNSWQNVVDEDLDFARLAFHMAPDGEIRLRGHVRGGDTNTAIFRLPMGYRPEYTETFRQPNDTGGSATISIQSDGYVVMLYNATF